jgi:hypothetical protein
MLTVGYAATLLSAECQSVANKQVIGSALLVRFDINGNGRIDVEERTKEFVRTQTRLRLEAAKAHAVQRGRQGGLKLDDLKVSSPTRAQFMAHDANGNGRLEVEERTRLETALREGLVRRFRLADVNGDGVLDRNEARAMGVKVRQSTMPARVEAPVP